MAGGGGLNRSAHSAGPSRELRSVRFGLSGWRCGLGPLGRGEVVVSVRVCVYIYVHIAVARFAACTAFPVNFTLLVTY